MKVELEKSFPVPAPADATWRFLQNIEDVAACMPGATITERLPNGALKGTVTVRIGPATMSFRGEVEARDTDAAGQKLAPQTLRLIGKGTDNTGTSGASLDLTARVSAVDSASSILNGKSEITMSGKAAAFGGRMMNSVADQVLKQFADNLAARIRESTANSATVSSQPQATPSTANQLNGLALVWAVIRGWFRGLFGRNTP
ncbi:MAG TPA: SRPBCC family protein [Steroidobacteraceae bacterium]|nr:SRPBCC family protein [Steroidobacteraceae bacterium]